MTWPLGVFKWGDAGHGVMLAFYASAPDNHFVGRGVAWAHPQADQAEGFCVSTLHFDTPDNAAWADGPQWHVEQMHPLTTTPSILCTAHRDWHGYITDGRWVPC